MIINEIDLVVIQKVEFDSNIILSEIERMNVDVNYYLPTCIEPFNNAFCTKQFFTKYFQEKKIPMKHKSGASLTEIYQYFVSAYLPKNKHNALTDAQMLYDIYFEAKLQQIL